MFLKDHKEDGKDTSSTNVYKTSKYYDGYRATNKDILTNTIQKVKPSKKQYGSPKLARI